MCAVHSKTKVGSVLKRSECFLSGTYWPCEGKTRKERYRSAKLQVKFGIRGASYVLQALASQTRLPDTPPCPRLEIFSLRSDRCLGQITNAPVTSVHLFPISRSRIENQKTHRWPRRTLQVLCHSTLIHMSNPSLPGIPLLGECDPGLKPVSNLSRKAVIWHCQVRIDHQPRIVGEALYQG